jgi:DNA-directed RNA polymerase alpha subunit
MFNEKNTVAIAAENKKLKSENKRLKKKLGLPIKEVKKTPTLRKSVQNTKIEKLSLNERTIKTLNKEGIFTIGELVAHDQIDITHFRNVGIKTISEIETALEKSICI